MKAGKYLLIIIILILLFSGCGLAFRQPYLSLDLKTVYNRADIIVNYTYVCEIKEQRCVYNLYNNAEPAVSIAGDDAVLPHSGQLEFTGLVEGNYRLEFTVYSEKDGESYPLKFLDESYDFSVDLP